MFTSFRKLFSKVTKSHDVAEADADADAEEESHNGSWQTTSSSPRLKAPQVCAGITLWPHQEAMLARLKHIEDHPLKAKCTQMFQMRNGNFSDIVRTKNYVQDVSLGVMNDPPGSGKTYAVLALIALDKKPSTNVIVAPKNLITQWRLSLAAMFASCGGSDEDKDKDKDKDEDKDKEAVISWTVANYDFISKLYILDNRFKDGKKTRVILVEDSLIDAFALACDEVLDRVIFDEIDNLKGAMTQPINAQKLWLVSASFKPDSEGCLSNYPYELVRGGDIHKVVCFTDPAFIAESVKLDDPLTESIRCDDRDIALCRGLVQPDIITSLHAGNIRPFLKNIDYTHVHASTQTQTQTQTLTVYDAVIWWLTDLERQITKYTLDLNEAQKALQYVDDGDLIALKRLEETITLLNNQITRTSHKRLTLKTRLESYVPVEEGKTKAHIFSETIVPRILSSSQDSRWLIFNDDLGGLLHASNVLERSGVPCAMLDGGTGDKVAATIESFKSGKVSVLLINSMAEGCGLNLEFVSHVLFMHATNPKLVGQVIGRAQRFGRKGALNVIGLFNDMELAEISGGTATQDPMPKNI